MSKYYNIEKWKSDAFIIWLQYIGYRIQAKGMQVDFIPTYPSKHLPRGGCIKQDGRLNRQANTLFKEFQGHLDA